MITSFKESVRHALSEVARESNSGVASCNDPRLTEILCLDTAIHLSREILSNDNALNETASQSYTHSNGFDKISLLSNRDPDFRVRLNVWSPRKGSGQSEEFIHSHRWHFRSTVLCGSTTMETFTEGLTGKPFYRHQYAPRNDKTERYGLRVVGESKLGQDLMLTLARGSTYSMGPDRLHRVRPNSNSITVTLFARWNVVRQAALVFSELPIHDEELLSVPSFTGHQLQLKLQEVLAELYKHKDGEAMNK